MPFDELKSDDAQSRLSRCRPVSGFRPSHCEDGKVMFAHNCGEAPGRAETWPDTDGLGGLACATW